MQKPVSEYSDDEYKKYLGSMDLEEIKSVLASVDRDAYPGRYRLALEELKRGDSIREPKLRYERIFKNMAKPKPLLALLGTIVGYFLLSLISGRRPLQRLEWFLEDWWVFLAVLVFVLGIAALLHRFSNKEFKRKEEYLLRHPEIQDLDNPNK